MCNKAVDNYPHALEFVSECYNTEKLFDKDANTNSSIMQFVPECYKTQGMWDKAFNKCFLTFFVFLINIKIKKYMTELFLNIFFQ